MRSRAARSLLLLTVAGSAACGLQGPALDGARTGPVELAQAGGQVAPRATAAPTAGEPASPVDPAASAAVPEGGAPQVAGPASGGRSPVLPSSRPGAAAATLRGELVVSVVNVTGWDQLASVVVVTTTSTGDAQAQARALESWVNARGGIAGRRLVVKVHDYNAQSANEVNDNNLCRDITTQDKAFLVNLQGQIHVSARACYAARKTLVHEGATFGWGTDVFARHSPYLWAPSYADYDTTVRALVASAKRRGWLAGQERVGVVLWDDPPYQAVTDRSLVPALRAAGVKEVVKAAVSNADIGSIENGIHAAAQTMVASGVTHLLFVGSPPLQPFFVQQNQHYSQFVYGLTSFDIPRYMADNFPANMAGAVGIGFSPVNDVLDAQHPFPQPGLETTCKKLYEAAGVTMPGRFVNTVFDAKQAISYCESVLLLKHVADRLDGPLTPERWAAEAERLGSAFQTAQTFASRFAPGRHTGPVVYRDLAFDGGCSCIRYTSGNRPLP